MITDKIKESIDETSIKNLLSILGATHIKMYGKQIRCTCPIHKGDNSTAFVWNLESNLWYCHTSSCGGGDIFDLVAKVYDYDLEEEFMKCLKDVCTLLNIDISKEDLNVKVNRDLKETREFIKKQLEKLNKKEHNRFDLSLLGTLKDIKKYNNFDESFLKENEIKYSIEMSRVIFPIKDENGIIIGASCRRTKKEEAVKWLHRPKGIYTGSILYNLNNVIGKFTLVFVVEGITDCLNLKRIGIENVVCTFGARITDEQKNMLMKYFEGIILAFDNDKAGQEATEKCKPLRFVFNLYKLNLDEKYKDVGEIEDIEEFNKQRIERVV